MLKNELEETCYLPDNLYTECAYYPQSKRLVVINNSGQPQQTTIETDYGPQVVELEAFDTVIRVIGG